MQDSHVKELFDAIAKHEPERVKRLVDARADLARARNEAGVSALMLARYSNLSVATEAMLAHNPDLDVFESATFGRVDRLRQLLDDDASLATARSPDGATALHLACFFSQPDCAGELIARGADVNAVAATFGNARPLHSAAAARNADIVAMLLAAGADPNARQDHGWTALHSAAHSGDVVMARVLLQHGAASAITAENGQTAADLAEEAKHPDLAQTLRGPM